MEKIFLILWCLFLFTGCDNQKDNKNQINSSLSQDINTLNINTDNGWVNNEYYSKDDFNCEITSFSVNADNFVIIDGIIKNESSRDYMTVEATFNCFDKSGNKIENVQAFVENFKANETRNFNLERSFPNSESIEYCEYINIIGWK
ncbi:MAG: hypothetical protein HFI86_02005 [Bacilli bacterium]|nr:hypothetical protein [Bacilli bacterium]